MTQLSAALKPCPSCPDGGTPMPEHFAFQTMLAPHFVVQCEKCGFAGPSRKEAKDAWDDWNRRALEPRDAVPVSELETMLAHSNEDAPADDCSLYFKRGWNSALKHLIAKHTEGK